MYKRIFTICLSCLLLFSVITMPARADDYAADGFYLDLCELWGYSSQTIYGSGGTVSFDYPLSMSGSTILAFDYEICVVASGAEPILISITPDTDFVVSNTVNGFFVRGSFDGASIDFVSLLFTADGESNLSILSFKIYLQRYLFSNFAAVCSSGYATLPLSPGSSVTVPSVPVDDGIYMPINFSIKVSKTYWADMDYMEFSFTIQAQSIDSISAYSTADNYLPIDINYIEQGFNTDSDLYDQQWFYVSGSVDLRSMDDVNTSGDIQIIISCVGGSPQAVMTVTGLRGIHYSGLFNTDYYWFSNLCFILSEMNLGIIITVENGISSITSAIDSAFSSISSTLTDFFKFDFNNPYDPNLTNPLWGSIYYFFSEISIDVSNGFASVRDKFNQLIDVLSPDPVDESVTDDMQQAGSELGGMTDQMQQASPSITPDDVNVDVGTLVDPGAMSSATVLLTVVTGVPFVQQLLLIVASFALIGFVFFGKR